MIDKSNRQVMVIKVYDKVIQLVGKDGFNFIGSAFKQVVGAVGEKDVF